MINRVDIVIALSADAQESTKQLCLSNGFNAFFSKPLKRSKPHLCQCITLSSLFASR
jgi:CheY-like chemotaxis protein